LSARPDENAATFKSGWLGNYFVQLIKPKEKLNKMKTPAEMNPGSTELSRTSIDRFIKQQKRWLQLLEQAGKVNLTTVKTAISLSKWIRLRLGDTLRFVIHHNDRHLVQAEKIWEAQRSLAMSA
ncbi:MAG: DinB family protein, partial [Phaeodactylibacter sp.]|nr:DinB family protein [Phaeodactylibacter sp.]